MKTIPLSQGQVALVDDDDFAKLSKVKWYLRSGRSLYAARMIHADGKRKIVYMHRMLMKPMNKQVVDHRNGNGLDNRRENLRLCTQSENQRNARLRRDNSVGLKGVARYSGKFRARIVVNGTQIYLGLFSTPEEAHEVYRHAAVAEYGDFARTT